MDLYIDVLDKYLNIYSSNNKVGVINGESGLILLLANLYYNTNKEKYWCRIHELLDKATETKGLNFTFGYGWSGFTWILLQLESFDYLENGEFIRNGLEKYMENEFYLMLGNNNIDYFNGSSGILFYFIEKKCVDIRLQNMANAFVDVVSKKIINNDWEKRLVNPEDRLIYKVVNLGIPHGISGTLLMLLLLHEYKVIDCTTVINRLIDVLLKYKLKDKSNLGSYFPSKIVNDVIKDGGVAWCNGDLMIAYAILKAGLLLNDNYYQNFAIQILLETLHRKNYHQDRFVLCHGYTSLPFIYQSIYNYTGEKCFENQSSIWNTKTIDLFDSFLSQKNSCVNFNIFQDNSSLFYGFSGLLLSLITWENSDSNKWVSCLLL